MRSFIIFFSFLLVFARENPFEPVVNPINRNIVKYDYFTKKEIFLPSDARVLKKIIFVYQSLDSDIKKKEVVINKQIDFHSPIVFYHVPKKFENRTIDFKLFKLIIKGKTIFIKTKDKLLRDFFLSKPFRIVLDFERVNYISTIKKELIGVVKKVVVGSHDYFYRIVLWLDATYQYKLKKLPDGVKIELY